MDTVHMMFSVLKPVPGGGNLWSICFQVIVTSRAVAISPNKLGTSQLTKASQNHDKSIESVAVAAERFYDLHIDARNDVLHFNQLQLLVPHLYCSYSEKILVGGAAQSILAQITSSQKLALSKRSRNLTNPSVERRDEKVNELFPCSQSIIEDEDPCDKETKTDGNAVSTIQLLNEDLNSLDHELHRAEF
jgi:hypothetical protein